MSLQALASSRHEVVVSGSVGTTKVRAVFERQDGCWFMVEGPEFGDPVRRLCWVAMDEFLADHAEAKAEAQAEVEP